MQNSFQNSSPFRTAIGHQWFLVELQHSPLNIASSVNTSMLRQPVVELFPALAFGPTIQFRSKTTLELPNGEAKESLSPTPLGLVSPFWFLLLSSVGKCAGCLGGP